MSNAVAVTDADFEQQVEQNDELDGGGFLGDLVRPVPHDRADPRPARGRLQGQVKVTKLDVDANIKTATRFNVRSIPMLLFFKGGRWSTRSSAPCRARRSRRS